MTAKDQFSKARAGLVLDSPFFGSLALRLRVKEDETCKTAYTDGTVLGYNPKFITGLSLEETKGLVAHEVMHCACAHHARRSGRDGKKWNRAADYAINPILTDAGMKIPAGGLSDPAYAGMSADEIYSKLPDEQDGGGTDPGQWGEVRDAQDGQGNAISPADMGQVESNWKVAVTQAAQEARSQGKLPTSLDRLVSDIVAPKLDWREVLRRFVQQSARNDYRMFPPNRRFLHMGLYLPSVRSEELPPVVVAVDTSGSVDEALIAQFAAELNSLLADYQTSCTVIYCDAAVQHVQEFSSQDLPLTLEAKGGGGTDFVPVFDYVAEHNLTPSCLIYLTDMAGEFPTVAPDYPVMWVDFGGYGIEAPFGESVRM